MLNNELGLSAREPQENESLTGGFRTAQSSFSEDFKLVLLISTNATDDDIVL